MSSITPIVNRTSTLLSSQRQLSQLQATQQQLFEAEQQISTGQSINRPSDAPEKVATVQYLERRLAERDQQGRNIESSLNVLDTADQSLNEANNILLEATTIASSQVGVGSDEETRAAESLVIDSQVQGLIEAANARFGGLTVFGGNNGTAEDRQLFESYLGGVRYNGSTENLATDVGMSTSQDFTSNGLDAFGALSARVQTDVDLDPALTANQRLSDLDGALGRGVAPGPVMLTINAVQVEVDLTYASTADDVVTRINDAITTQAPGAGTLAVNATGFTLTGNGGNTISIDDGVGGTTAADLGLRGLSSTGGVPAAGDDVGVRLTPLTELTNLGATIDWASGISVTQGGVTQTLDFSAATTVEDLQNVVRNADLGLRLEVNSDGSGLDMVSEVAGIELAVGEAGGTTAADLGLRSYDQDTALNDFRFGLGVNFQEGENDLAITLHDGTSFEVNLDGSTSLGDVTAAIQAAAAAAGLTTAQFDVQFATTGTGLVFTDNTVGASDFQVENANLSLAGSHLGIVQNAGAAATFTSDDRATVRVENSFTHLINLRDALANNDEPGITIAGSNLEDDLDDIINARAVVGVQSKALQDTQTRAEDQKLQEQSMLSNLRDADLAEVISRYQQLQVQLQASLQMTAQSLQLSLMDFLR